MLMSYKMQTKRALEFLEMYGTVWHQSYGGRADT